jgi:hypothetical protein
MKTLIAAEPVETTCLPAQTKRKSMLPGETAGPEIRLRDYSLVGADSARAVEAGLAEADWYTSPVPKDKLRAQLARHAELQPRETELQAQSLAAATRAREAARPGSHRYTLTLLDPPVK